MPSPTLSTERPLFERVQLSRTLGSASESGPLLFEILRKNGRISKIEGASCYRSRETLPLVQRDSEGRLFLTQGSLRYEMGGHVYEIELSLKPVKEELILEITAHAEALELMERLLAPLDPHPRVSVARSGLSAWTAAFIYRKLRDKSVFVSPVEISPFDNYWKLRLDQNHNVLPEKLTLELDDSRYPFLVKFRENDYRHTFEIAVESRLDQGEEAVSFLRDLIEEAKRAEPKPDPEPEPEKPKDSDEGRWEDDVQGYHWQNLAGIDDIVDRIRQWVELPLRNPDAFTTLGIRPPKGLLLHGPPGTGKSTLAKTAAKESGATFFSISSAEINSMWYGGSSRNVRRLFERIKNKAREGGGAILFIDEIDGFLRSREQKPHEATQRTLSQLMMEMDAITPELRIVIIAATNRLKDLDSALCRPGRFDHHVEVPLPDQAAREEILTVHLASKPCHPRLNLARLARESDGLSGADLEQWCNEATFQAWRRKAEKLGKDLAEMAPGELGSVRLAYADFRDSRPKGG